MPIARYQLNDGRVARFEVPDGTTPEQAQQIGDNFFTKQPETDLPAFDVQQGDQPGFDRPSPSFGEQAQAVGETALAVGSGLTVGALGGLAGTIEQTGKEIASGGFSLDPQEQAKAAERISVAAKERATGNIILPGSELGQKRLKQVGKALEPLSALAPNIAPEIGTLSRGLKTSIPRISKALDESVQPAISAGKELAIDLSKVKTPKQKAVIRQLQSGEISKDLARVKLEGLGIKEPTSRQKLLGSDLPKVVKDVPAVKAESQGFSPGFIDNIKKRASATDRKLMLEMTNISQRGKKDPLFEVDFRPADVAGKVMLEQVNAVKKINRAAGAKIGNARKFLAGEQLPVSHIGDNFKAALEGLKIKVVDGKLDFSNSLISGQGGRKKAINDIWNRMVNNKNPDALDLHELKQFIDETISYGKSVRGLGGKAEGTLRALRAEIKEALDSNFPKYAEANKVYSDTIQVIDEVQRLAGKRTDLTSGSAGGQLGKLMRRFMGNDQSRANVIELVSDLDKALKAHSGFGGQKRLPGIGEGQASLKLLSLYADELDKVFGSTARTSFTGGIETAIKATGSIPVTKTGAAQAALSGVEKIAKTAAGINEEGAFKAIRELLKESK